MTPSELDRRQMVVNFSLGKLSVATALALAAVFGTAAEHDFGAVVDNGRKYPADLQQRLGSDVVKPRDIRDIY